MPVSQTGGYFKNPLNRFLEEPILFLLLKVEPLKKSIFLY